MINYKMKAARTLLGMNQQDLAKAINVSRQTIILIEQGEYNPSLKLCTDICKTLHMTLNDLFWEDKTDDGR